jgi:hypothetical protein
VYLTPDQLRAFRATLEDVLPAALDQLRSRHPLLARANIVKVGQIEVEADVDLNQPVAATYEIPLMSAGVSMRLDPGIGGPDQLVTFARHIIEPTVRAYEWHLRRALYDPNGSFLGVSGLLPAAVGHNVIAGIDEASTPGWRSHVTESLPDPYDTFVVAEARSMRQGEPPDLTILGTNAYRGLVQRIQPQQRMHTVSGGISMLVLHSGSIFHDPFCETDSGFIMHSGDFEFHASPIEVVADLSLDGRVSVRARRRQQMISTRRFRSGTITPPIEFSDAVFDIRRRR